VLFGYVIFSSNLLILIRRIKCCLCDASVQSACVCVGQAQQPAGRGHPHQDLAARRPQGQDCLPVLARVCQDAAQPHLRGAGRGRGGGGERQEMTPCGLVLPRGKTATSSFLARFGGQYMSIAGASSCGICVNMVSLVLCFCPLRWESNFRCFDK